MLSKKTFQPLSELLTSLWKCDLLRLSDLGNLKLVKLLALRLVTRWRKKSKLEPEYLIWVCLLRLVCMLSQLQGVQRSGGLCLLNQRCLGSSNHVNRELENKTLYIASRVENSFMYDWKLTLIHLYVTLILCQWSSRRQFAKQWIRLLGLIWFWN